MIGRIGARLNAAERALDHDLSGICSHLPAIVERRDQDGHLMPREYSPWVRDRMSSVKKSPDDAVCPCGRPRLRFLVQYHRVGIHGQPVDE